MKIFLVGLGWPCEKTIYSQRKIWRMIDKRSIIRRFTCILIKPNFAVAEFWDTCNLKPWLRGVKLLTVIGPLLHCYCHLLAAIPLITHQFLWPHDQNFPFHCYLYCLFAQLVVDAHQLMVMVTCDPCFYPRQQDISLRLW